MPNVYIPNRSGHDFSGAKNFGDLVFVTDGRIEKFRINNMYRIVVEKLEGSHPDDFIMATGLTQINVVLASVFAFKHGRLNLLIYDVKTDTYVPRKIVLSNLLKGKIKETKDAD